MFLSLLLSVDYTIGGPEELEKMRTDPAGAFSLTANVAVPADFVALPRFTGVLYGHGHVLTLADAGSFATATENARFIALTVKSTGASLVLDAVATLFQNVTLESTGKLFGTVDGSFFISSAVKYGAVSAISNSKGTKYNGVHATGAAPFAEAMTDGAITASYFAAACTTFAAETGYGAVASKMEGTAMHSSKVQFSAESADSAVNSNLGGIAAYGKKIKFLDVDVYASFKLKTGGMIGGMLAEHDGANEEGNEMIIANCSVASVFDTTTETTENSALRAGAIARNTDVKLMLAMITVYTQGTIRAQRDTTELFGGFVANNNAWGKFSRIYVMADVKLDGNSYSAAGLISLVTFMGEDQNTIQHCVVKMWFSGSLADNTCVAGMIGQSDSKVSVQDCSVHGAVNVEVQRIEYETTLALAGCIGRVTNWLQTSVLTFYTTLSYDVVAGSGSYKGCLAIGGLYALLYSIQSVAASVDCDHIQVSGAFENVTIGGLAAISQDPTYVKESLIVVRQLTVAPYDGVQECAIGGMVGTGMMSGGTDYTNVFMYVTCTTSASDAVQIGIIVGNTRTRAQNSVNSLYVFKSTNKTDIELVPGQRISQRPKLECKPEYNLVQIGECVDDAKTQEIAEQLGTKWKYDAARNGGYPHVIDTVFKTDAGVGFDADSQYYKPDEYFVDAGLVFSKSDYNFLRGAANATGLSPGSFACNYETKSKLCLDAGAAMLQAQLCTANETQTCEGLVISCAADSEFVNGVCTKTCAAKCKFGRCSNSVCECAPQASGDACSSVDCSASAAPCLGVATCNTGKCVCSANPDIFDPMTASCTLGCPGLVHGECTNIGEYVCDKGYADNGDELCSVCAPGNSVFAGKCTSDANRIGAIAGIAIAAVLVVAAVIGAIVYCVCAKKKRSGAVGFQKARLDTEIAADNAREDQNHRLQ